MRNKNPILSVEGVRSRRAYTTILYEFINSRCLHNTISKHREVFCCSSFLPTEVTLTTDEVRQVSRVKVWISISSFMRRFPMILVNVDIQPLRIVRFFKDG
jgi:hypothetical protein